VYQESLVRLSLIQKMQRLAVDVLDNKNDSATVNKRLGDMTTELQSNAAQDQLLKKENILLKQELNNVKNLIMEKIQSLKETEISALTEKMKGEISNFKLELNETNQRIDGEATKLKQELAYLNEANKQFNEGNKNVNRRLGYMATTLQSNAAQDHALKKENVLLKHELNNVRNFIIGQIQSLNETEISALADKVRVGNSRFGRKLRRLADADLKAEQENSKLGEELKILNERNKKIDKENTKLRQEMIILNKTNQRLDGENSKLRDELSSVKATSNNNTQKTKDLKGMDDTLSTYIEGLKAQLHLINGSLLEISSKFTSMSGK
jgi:chromosome segregation ATPase